MPVPVLVLMLMLMHRWEECLGREQTPAWSLQCLAGCVGEWKECNCAVDPGLTFSSPSPWTEGKLCDGLARCVQDHTLDGCVAAAPPRDQAHLCVAICEKGMRVVCPTKTPPPFVFACRPEQKPFLQYGLQAKPQRRPIRSRPGWAPCRG